MEKIERTYLNTKTRFQLTQKIHVEYIQSKLSDIDFAKKAATDLGFPVTAGHVTYIRREFDIPANSPQGVSAQNRSRVYDLIRRVEELEALVETLLRERQEHRHHA